MKKILFVLFVLLVGCAGRPVIEINGLPAGNFMVYSNIIDPPIEVRYDLVRYYNEKEGDEILECFEYLKISPAKKHFIKKEEISFLVLEIRIQNNNKSTYSVRSKTKLKKGGEKVEIHYSGDLSRKTIKICLPVECGDVEFYFDILNENGNIAMRSFDIRYKVL